MKSVGPTLYHLSLMSFETYLARSSGLGASASWASSLATSSSDLKMTGIMLAKEFPSSGKHVHHMFITLHPTYI